MLNPRTFLKSPKLQFPSVFRKNGLHHFVIYEDLVSKPAFTGKIRPATSVGIQCVSQARWITATSTGPQQTLLFPKAARIRMQPIVIPTKELALESPYVLAFTVETSKHLGDVAIEKIRIAEPRYPEQQS